MDLLRSVILVHLALLPCCFNLVAGTAGDSLQTMIQDLAWAHDDQSIYFSAMKVKKDYSDYRPDLWTVYRYDINNGRLHTILNSAIYVSISPDGSLLALSVNEGNRRMIYTTDREGASPVRIIDMGPKSFAPCWSPDGSKIIFNSDASGQVEIYQYHLDSKVINQLTHSGGANAYNPVFSPGGKYITYYLAKGDGKDQVHIMNSDGSEDRNLTRDTFNNIFPGWFDKENIIYGQGSSDQITKLYKLKIKGMAKKQIKNINSFYGRVSHDDRRLAYIDTENGRIIIDSKRNTQIVQVSNLIDDQ